MDTTLKKELHELIDGCDNDLLLKEVKELFSYSSDWWDDLSEEDKNLLMESETEYEKGNYTQHEKLMQEFDEWKKK